MPAKRPVVISFVGTLLAWATQLAGCAPASEATSFTGGSDFATGVSQIVADNGLSANGMSANGLSANGLSANGLSANGLGTTAFKNWFNQNAATSPAVMTYLYACAAPAGSTLSWTNPTSGKAYTWLGLLGLAPGWVGGKAATVAEQQLITACLAAHVNMYGVHVPIAVEGRTATGAQIPILPSELATFSWREACFFGNIFNGEGVFLAYDRPNWPANTSSSRGCALDINGKPVSCPPIVTTGDECRDICTADATGTFWESCSWNGKSYKPVTTRIRPAEVHTCGDGVCQFTEKCGTGLTADSCADCGPCR